MSHWNYRVMKKSTGEGGFEYGIYEVLHDEDGKVISYTEEPMTPLRPTPEDLVHELETMKEAFKLPVLDHL